MAINDTRITIAGNLADDPEMRFTRSGIPVCNMNVGVTPRTYDRDSGDWKDGMTAWHRCTAWRQQAENIAESLRRGDRVVVTGRLVADKWDDKEGNTHFGWHIDADEVAPSLMFATANITKTTVTKAQRERMTTPPDDPWATASQDRPEPVTAAAGGSWGSAPADNPPF